MQTEHILVSPVIFLTAAVIAVPLFNRFGLGSILGYLTAGAAIGPWGLGLISEAAGEVMHIAELGVVMLLFLIGLELKPSRLWVMRRSIFGLGTIQVFGTAFVLCIVFLLLGQSLMTSYIAGSVLSLSSTALVIQLLSERGELSSRYGRAGFSILLFQDLAVIPFLAALSIIASTTLGAEQIAPQIIAGLAAVFGVIFLGRYAVNPLFYLIARSKSDEIFTAAALLIVLGVSALMQWAGLSMGLGAFLAGVLLAESEYRPQIQADIMPFRGLLLGLFFVTVGMTIDFGLLVEDFLYVLMLVPILISVKTILLTIIARASGHSPKDSFKLGLTMSQGGEFGFVLFSAAVASGLMASEYASLLIVVIAISMGLTPLILLIFDRTIGAHEDELHHEGIERIEDIKSAEHPKVILLGFGRVGQIAGKILLQEDIDFVALDYDPGQIELARKMGYKVYFGDAARTEVMLAAGAQDAEILIVAVDNPDTSLRIIQAVSRRFPHLKILARARNREHAQSLMGVDIHYAMRETLECGLSLGKQTLETLGISPEEAHSATELFREEDEKLLRQSLAEIDKSSTQSTTPAQAAAVNSSTKPPTNGEGAADEKAEKQTRNSFWSLIKIGS